MPARRGSAFIAASVTGLASARTGSISTITKRPFSSLGLKLLRFRDRRPTPIYYYRELQNLRDPLHFRATAPKRESA